MKITNWIRSAIIKLNIFDETSERRFGIMQQPPPTCPMIDELILIIKQQKLAHEVDMIHKLEYIRTNTKNIRAWGQEWKTAAKQAYGLN